jgi:hypothetical protein
MKLDNWTRFNLTAETRQLVDAFAAPDHEQAIIKNVPIGAYETAHRSLSEISSLTGRLLSVRFRGPRYDPTRASCRRENARAFSVYLR